MFEGCSSLQEVQPLNAMTLAPSCYKLMFNDCHNLTTVPTTLPATTLATNCYTQMFQDCNNLIKGPYLPATTLIANVYDDMFHGCENLSTVPGSDNYIPKTPAQTNMFLECYELREPVNYCSVPPSWGGGGGTCGVFAVQNATSVTPAFTLGTNGKLEYSLNRGASWINATSGTAINTNGNDIAFRGTNVSNHNNWAIAGTGIRIRGNLSTTINYQLPPAGIGDNAFKEMFMNCTNLVYADITLPALTVGENSYRDMFSGCTNMISCPDLQATTVNTNSYFRMFKDCKSLKVPPKISAMNLGTNCFAYMFENCDGLTDIPFLPAKNLAQGCYSGMFMGSKGLVNINMELPATTVVASCYYAMFYNCINLVKAPELKAKTLISNCYYSMFSGCTKLTDAPYSQLYTNSSTPQAGMFTDCTKLSTPLPYCAIPESFGGSGACTNCIIISYARGITPRWSVPGSPLEYSLDSGTTWQNATSGTRIDTQGHHIRFRGSGRNQLFNVATSSNSWVLEGDLATVEIYGNICNLLDYQNPPTTINDNAFAWIFAQNASLRRGPALGATAIGFASYAGMFEADVNLTSAPQIIVESTGEKGFHKMFKNARSLQTPPKLPAMSLGWYCYQDMFNTCTAMTSFPDLPANEVVTGAYQAMFYGCTAAKGTPWIGMTTTMFYSCQQMFENCTSLVNAPQLAPTKVESMCYQAMFRGCTSLVGAPRLPAAGINTLSNACYDSMFYGCTSLIEAPALPSSHLPNGDCYYSMFEGCSSLETAPGNDIYLQYGEPQARMFTRCYNLKHIIPFEDIPKAWGGGYDYFSVRNATSVTPKYTQSGPIIYYRFDGAGNWLPTNSGEPINTAGHSVEFRRDYDPDGNLFDAYSINNAWEFGGSNVQLSGDIMSLLGYDKQNLPVGNFGFNNMFRGCTNITTPPLLPATVIGNQSYQGMFYGCTGLNTVPDLPAPNVGTNSYQSMFQGCTNITTASNLPATTLGTATYQDMFSGCTKLTTAPGADRYTTYSPIQSHMFGECRALATPVPYGNLPAGWD
jgi:hypothetical protein